MRAGCALQRIHNRSHLDLDYVQWYLDWDLHTWLPHELDSCHNHNHFHENWIYSTPAASKHNPASEISHEQGKNEGLSFNSTQTSC